MLSTYSAAADPTWCRPVQSCINGNSAPEACLVQRIPCLTLSCEYTFSKADSHHLIEERSITKAILYDYCCCSVYMLHTERPQHTASATKTRPNKQQCFCGTSLQGLSRSGSPSSCRSHNALYSNEPGDI